MYKRCWCGYEKRKRGKLTFELRGVVIVGVLKVLKYPGNAKGSKKC
jgi:hypothetical protein